MSQIYLYNFIRFPCLEAWRKHESLWDRIVVSRNGSRGIHGFHSFRGATQLCEAEWYSWALHRNVSKILGVSWKHKITSKTTREDTKRLNNYKY